MVVMLPFLVAMIAMIGWGRSSDIRGERIWHIAVGAMTAALGLAVAGLAQNHMLVLVGLTLALIGTLSLPGPLFSVPSTFLSGAGAASAIALVNAMGSLGRFLGPTVVGAFKQDSETYASAMLALSLGLLMSSVVILTVRRTAAPRLSRAH
jgi:ACS family tartrate transporter-like MFS transporter